MKIIISTAISLIIAGSLYGQEASKDTTKSKYKNVVEIFASGLLKQFFSPSQYYSYYNPASYMISYRRMFNNNSIHLSIGGHVYVTNGITNDTSEDKSSSNDFITGLGYERYSSYGKSWALYYGIEAVFNSRSYSYSQNKYSYEKQYSSKTNKYGLAPLLGVVFRINKLLSVSTETSYHIYYTQSDTKNDYDYYYYPPEKSHTKSTGIETRFIAPTTINFRFQF